MVSDVKMKCPVHRVEITSMRKVPFSLHGNTVQEAIFYCDKCDRYYVHTDAVPYGSSFDYGDKKVTNTPERIYGVDESRRDVVCTGLSKLRSYTPPFIPEICYKDQEPLKFVSNAILRIDGMSKEIKGYCCDKCYDFYVQEDEYDDICYEFGDTIHEYGYKNLGTDNTEDNDKLKRRYSIENIRPSSARHTTAEVAGKILSYEDCEKNYDISYPFSLLHYAFIFRRFDAVLNIIKDFDHSDMEEALYFAGPKGYEWITPLVCAKWNLNFIWAYDDRNNTKLADRLEEFLSDVGHIDEVMEYTDSIDKDNHDVFSVFWNGSQPLLDVVYYEKQSMASAQVLRNDFSIVMDEVGTGKTVSALYAIREIIQEKAHSNQKAGILVVCPYNKREDWQDDIRRQLGRYAHIVEQGDNGEMYKDNQKKIFFKCNEHIIMISGQRQGSDKNGSHSALKGSIESYSGSPKWDLAIIDEVHISFSNYFGISAGKVMLMTATPVVVNAKGKRTFDDYLELVSKILNKRVDAVIDPISKAVPDVEDKYVNWFREDMGQASAERKIRFVPCKRWTGRDDIFYQIKDEKGALAALQYDQDDYYLYWAAVNNYGLRNIHKPGKNAKLERLISLLHEDNKSFIIFCEHQFVADEIFRTLKDEFSGIVVAEKYGRHENQRGLDNVQDGQLVNTLMQALRNSERVLFITTGKTGGTGLNLGEFDGIIHYELPFTSIELEQRFGRVDRIDTTGSGNIKDMVFLLNECKADENDMEINRMLYYCTTKIDVTCQFMPVRNTVLYYPEFIKRNGKAIRESLESLRKEYVLSETNENKIKDFHRNIRELEKRIKKDPIWIYVEPLDKNIRFSALAALSNARDDRISEQYYELLHEYLEYWKKTRPERRAYQKMYRVFLEAKKNAHNWLAILGLVKVEKDSEIFIGYEQKDDGDEDKISQNEESLDIRAERRNGTVQQQISEIIELIDGCVFDEEKLRNFSADGIFCYKDGMIRRSGVKSYREGYGWH